MILNACLTDNEFSRALSKERQKEDALASYDFVEYVSLHDDEDDGLDAFFHVAKELTGKQYWSVLRELWETSGLPYMRKGDWLKLFKARRKGRIAMMNADEAERFLCLPKLVKVYRGFSRETEVLGMSWSLSQEVAEWFAKNAISKTRISLGASLGSPMVAEALIPRRYIFRLLFKFEEEEVVLNPKHLQSVKIAAATKIEGLLA